LLRPSSDGRRSMESRTIWRPPSTLQSKRHLMVSRGTVRILDPIARRPALSAGLFSSWERPPRSRCGNNILDVPRALRGYAWGGVTGLWFHRGSRESICTLTTPLSRGGSVASMIGDTQRHGLSFRPDKSLSKRLKVSESNVLSTLVSILPRALAASIVPIEDAGLRLTITPAPVRLQAFTLTSHLALLGT